MAQLANKRPLSRNPYFWAALVGLIAIPLMRPCLRRIPPAPAVTGIVPDFSAVNDQHETLTKSQLIGSVYVLSFAATRSEVQRARLVAERMSHHQVNGHVVNLLLSSYAGPLPSASSPVETTSTVHWHSFNVAGNDSVLPLIDAARNQAHSQNPPWHAFLFLVDDEGRFRGAYPPHADQAEEILHRAVHLILEK